MKNLLLIPIFSMLIYLIYVYIKYGMTESISKTFAKLKPWEQPFFTIMLTAVAFPIMYIGIETAHTELAKGLFFLAGSLIVLVGASPKFWESRMENTAHLIGSYGGIGIGVIACFVAGFPVLSLIPVFIFVLFTGAQFLIEKSQLPNHIYWVEVMAFFSVALVLRLQL